VHRDNLPWIFENGLHCGNSKHRSESWVNIGNQELIDKRQKHCVLMPPGGTLNDYVPFYFTPFSVMLKNIHSGRGGVKQRSNDEIVILVSSIHKVNSAGLDFLFTDSHAYYQWTSFYKDIKDLDQIDWPLLQSRDFKRDADDPAKFERYQAEALIHNACPMSALLGVICYNDATQQTVQKMLQSHNLDLQVHVRPGWYFK
jgi:hypothetical protein